MPLNIIDKYQKDHNGLIQIIHNSKLLIPIFLPATLLCPPFRSLSAGKHGLTEFM